MVDDLVRVHLGKFIPSFFIRKIVQNCPFMLWPVCRYLGFGSVRQLGSRDLISYNLEIDLLIHLFKVTIWVTSENLNIFRYILDKFLNGMQNILNSKHANKYGFIPDLKLSGPSRTIFITKRFILNFSWDLSNRLKWIFRNSFFCNDRLRDVWLVLHLPVFPITTGTQILLTSLVRSSRWLWANSHWTFNMRWAPEITTIFESQRLFCKYFRLGEYECAGKRYTDSNGLVFHESGVFNLFMVINEQRCPTGNSACFF